MNVVRGASERQVMPQETVLTGVERPVERLIRTVNRARHSGGAL